MTHGPECPVQSSFWSTQRCARLPPLSQSVRRAGHNATPETLRLVGGKQAGAKAKNVSKSTNKMASSTYTPVIKNLQKVVLGRTPPSTQHKEKFFRLWLRRYESKISTTNRKGVAVRSLLSDPMGGPLAQRYENLGCLKKKAAGCLPPWGSQAGTGPELGPTPYQNCKNAQEICQKCKISVFDPKGALASPFLTHF